MISVRVLGTAVAALLAASAALGGEAEDGKGPLQESRVVEHLRFLTLMALGRAGVRLDRDGQIRDDPAAAQAAAEMEQRYLASGMAPDQAARLARQMAGMRSGSGVDGAFRKIATAARANRMSSSSGNDEASSDFSGGSIEGKFSRKKEAVEVELVEKSGPERTLTLKDDGDGLFELTLGTEKGGAVLKLSSKPKDGFRADWRRGGEKRSVAGKSFAEVYAGNRGLLEDDLFPFMKELGLGVPPTPMNPEMIRTVLDEFRPISEADRADAAKLFARLDSAEFEEREKASRDLAAAYGRMRRLVAEQLARKDISMEVRDRLEKAVKGDSGRTATLQAVKDLGLLDDAGYLRALLPKLEGADRELVAGRLKKLEAAPGG